MTLTGDDLLAALWDSALALDEHELWNEFEEDEIFAARLPDEEYPWFITVPAADDTGGTLFITRGKSGFRDMVDLSSGEEDGGDMADQVRLLSLHVSEPEDVPPAVMLMDPEDEDEDEFGLVPYIIVKEPGQPPAGVNEADAKNCLMLFNGLARAHEDGLLDNVKNYLPDAPIVTIVLEGDPAAPEVSAETVVYQAPPRLFSAYLPPEPGEIQKLKKLGKTWKVGYWYMPILADDDSRSVHCLAVLQEKKIIKRVVMAGRDLHEAARHLFDAIKGDNDARAKGRPKKIIFSGVSLFETVAPALRDLGIACALESRNEALALAYEDVLTALREERMLAEFEHMVAEPEPNFVPRSDDLQAWRKVNVQITARISREMIYIKEAPERALKQYFGDLDAAAYHLFDEDEEDEGLPALAMMCFGEWFCFHYRSGKGAKTVAERLLQGDLPAAQRLALEARARANVSLYVVEEIEAPGTITLTDVLFGSTVQVYDEELAETAETGMGLPLRVYRLGDFHFCILFGPGLPPFQTSEAAAYLLDHGIGDTPAAVAGRSHLFGLLWEWLEDLLVEFEDDQEDFGEYDDDDEPGGWFPPLPGPAKGPVDLDQMQRLLDEFFMQWLDTPQNILDGKSPRQAAQARDGKRKVASIIRGLAPPPGQAGLTVPRERMLRELGLDQD